MRPCTSGRPTGSLAAAPLLRDLFVRFTNDLDQSRGQALQEANPRLYRALVKAGVRFRGRHLFVGTALLPRLVPWARARLSRTRPA